MNTEIITIANNNLFVLQNDYSPENVPEYHYREVITEEKSAAVKTTIYVENLTKKVVGITATQGPVLVDKVYQNLPSKEEVYHYGKQVYESCPNKEELIEKSVTGTLETVSNVCSGVRTTYKVVSSAWTYITGK